MVSGQGTTDLYKILLLKILWQFQTRWLLCEHTVLLSYSLVPQEGTEPWSR